MTLGARTAAVLALAAACASCESDSAQQGLASTTAASTTSSTTGSPSTTTGTAATTETSASASSGSTTTTTESSNSASSTGGTSSSTGGTTGIGGAAGDNGDSSTGTTNGAGGATSDSTTTGGTTAGVIVLEDECSLDPCGSALANTAWRHTRACVLKEQLIGPIQSFCPAITLVSSGGELTGAVSFTDDTYEQEVSFNLWLALDVPAECDITCTSFASTLAVMGFPDATCTESDSVCHCLGSAQGTDPRSGDYATSDDGTLAFVFPYGSIETSYCAGAGALSYLVPVNLVPQGTPMDVVYDAVPE